MKEFALIFRLKDISDFKPTPEQMQERMNWLAGIASQNKLVDKVKYPEIQMVLSLQNV